MRVLLRCDGGPGMGVGHAVRCLALAEEAVSRGHTVDLAGRLEGDFLEGLARSAPAGLRVLGPLSAAPDATGPLVQAALGYDVLHVDHYDIGPDVLPALLGSDAARRPVLSSMADGAYGARPSTLLVDPTVDAQWEEPPVAAEWHLRGARYVPLRSTVRDLRHEAPAAPSHPVGVLVVMGGADPAHCAPLVVDALAQTRVPMDVTVVATQATQQGLAERALRWPGGRLQVIPPSPDLPAMMARADVVVTAAGTSVWELCALGRPMAAVAVVDNQVAGYESLVRAGAAVGLGRPADLVPADAAAAQLLPLLEDAACRAEVARAAAGLVDGLGSWRIVRAWEEVVAGAAARRPQRVLVRPATAQDAELLWRWRNDPGTRHSSRSREEVPMDAHLRWLHATLRREDRRLLVGEQDGQPVGTVRWDLDTRGEWEVSITVAPERRGSGLAGALLRAGEDWLQDAHPDELAAYLASVHVDNVASRRLFLGAGYLPDLPADEEGFERFVKGVRSGPT